jgi:hypothetical protein
MYPANLRSTIRPVYGSTSVCSVSHSDPEGDAADPLAARGFRIDNPAGVKNLRRNGRA